VNSREKPSKKRPPRLGKSEPKEISRIVFWLLVLGVGLAAFALYLPTLRSDFVYDAEAQILINDYIHDPAHLVEVVTLQVLGNDVLDFNRPVQLFSLMVDSLLWGRNPWGYHLTSNLLHALNVSLLAALILQLVRGGAVSPIVRLIAAGLGALVFASHPVNVEPVAEVACREDLLATGGILVGLLCVGAFSRRTGWPAAGWAAGCVLALVLACGAKETGVVGPVLLVAYWGLFAREQSGRRWAWVIGSAGVAVGAFLALRFLLQPSESKIFTEAPSVLGGSYAAAVWIQPRLWVLSVKNILWPDALSADYQPANVMAIPFLWGLAGLALFIVGQGFLAFRHRVAALGMAVFWLGLAPVSNLIPIYRPLADRFLYLPMAGLALTVAGGLLMVAGRRSVFALVAVALIFLLFPLSALNLRRQTVFSNSWELWRDTLVKSPRSDTAANNLGYALIEKGNNQSALEAFQVALQLTDGGKPNALAGAAIAMENLHRPREAEECYQKAISLDEKYRFPDQLVESMAMTRDQAALLKVIQARMVRPEK